jgi:hypothetical protein
MYSFKRISKGCRIMNYNYEERMMQDNFLVVVGDYLDCFPKLASFPQYIILKP